LLSEGLIKTPTYIYANDAKIEQIISPTNPMPVPVILAQSDDNHIDKTLTNTYTNKAAGIINNHLTTFFILSSY